MVAELVGQMVSLLVVRKVDLWAARLVCLMVVKLGEWKVGCWAAQWVG